MIIIILYSWLPAVYRGHSVPTIIILLPWLSAPISHIIIYYRPPPVRDNYSCRVRPGCSTTIYHNIVFTCFHPVKSRWKRPVVSCFFFSFFNVHTESNAILSLHRIYYYTSSTVYIQFIEGPEKRHFLLNNINKTSPWLVWHITRPFE